MNRLQKILVTSVSLLVLTVFLLTLGIRLYFTDDRIQGIAEPFLEAQLNREVSIGGFEIRVFRSWPDIAVGITEVAIHSPSRNGVPSPDLASVRNIWVQVPLIPLFKKQLTVNKLELDQPRLLVEVYDDLSSNLIELASEVDSSQVTVNEPDNKATIALEDIRIRQGQVGYVHADGSILTLDNISTDLSVQLSDKAVVEGNTVVSNVYFETGGVSYIDNWEMGIEIIAESHIDSAWLRINQADLSVQDLALNLLGEVHDFDSDSIIVDLAFMAPGAPVSSFWSLLPASVTKDMSGLESEGVFSIQGTLNGVIAEEVLPDLNVDLSVVNGMVQYPGFPSSIENITVDALVTNSRLDVHEFSAEADGARVYSKASISNFSTPFVEVDLDLEVDLASLNQYYPLSDSTNLSGLLFVDASTIGPLESLEDLQLAGTVNVESVYYESALIEQPVRDLNGGIILENNEIAFQDVSLKSGESDLNVSGTLTGYQSFLSSDSLISTPRPRFKANIESSYLNLTEQISEDTTSTFVGPLELPPVDFELQLEADQLEFNGVIFANAAGEITINEGLVAVENIDARFLDGLLGANGNFDLSDPFSPVFNGDVRLRSLPASEFFASFSGMNTLLQFGDYLEGLFDSEASFGLSLDKDLNPVYESVIANGSFGARQASFGTMPIQSVIADYTGLTALESLNVDDWSHTYTVSGSRVHVQDLQLSAGEYTVYMNGTQSFDGGIDYRLQLVLPESASNVLANAPIQGSLSTLSSIVNASLKDPASGRVTLDLLATGSIIEPSVKLDAEGMKTRLISSLEGSISNSVETKVDSLEQAVRDRAEEELADQRQALEERAEQGIGQLVGGFVDSSLVETPVDSLKDKGAEALQDRLKGLLNRRKRNN